MLLEMASGNFFYRLERTSNNDILEAIAISLNMLAEEIQETMLHQGYVNVNDTFIQLVQMSFVLGNDGVIQMVNQQACNILSFRHSDIIKKSFTDFLDAPSKVSWQNLWERLHKSALSDHAIRLTFKTQQNLVLPKTCYITSLKNNNNTRGSTLITVVQHAHSQEMIENELRQQVIRFSNQQKDNQVVTTMLPEKPKLRLSFNDIRKIREGRDIIMNNLDKELPSLKFFALQLGTNEFKLKYGFKQLYGTTVYRFLLQERLRKSKMLIQYSDHSIKSIANLTGFKSLSHFSRTFKKRYGYTPSDLRKKSINTDS